MFGDREMVANRWRANPEGVVGAYIDGQLVGSNVVSRWGTFGWFGPLTIRPDLWDKGVAKALMGTTMELFSEWGTTHQGLFTFPNSPKHLALYGKFGFNARFLTPIMTKKPGGRSSVGSFRLMATLGGRRRTDQLKELRELTNQIYPGLDLTDEIQAAETLRLGDVVITGKRTRTEGFAICHSGPDTEGGTDNCFVKFGAVRPGEGAKGRFLDLLAAIEGYAIERKLKSVEAGVNMGRREAHRILADMGYRSEFVGVAMERPDEAGFNNPQVLALDDWR